ncbi:exodeoxyribonuclease VII large subunit [Tumebacillus algifaecis]|uniref:Exodeoxyribonuclease 7 large subunit n=1 Tax=Tumebacillus algifaecis TaxID=1214604 RepID=A0A223D2Q5_9BACL|nr:exodeoxyribonuclease VII large subunit [Tumebacillus algifaecis]ASS75938.1 exodeoxyribonuclease VII large subunit [Tumebacillus algifaecis]
MLQTREHVPSVSELTARIKGMFEADEGLQNCLVRGEISNFTHHSKGHMYFTLKDSQSRIKSVMFAGNNRSLKFIPKEGMKVIAHGYVSVFDRDGAYQLYVDDLQPDGLGSLFLAFQQLKEQLEREGLFDPLRKKPIPKYPRVVGVITSPTGAAVRDIITTIRRRYPVAHILLHPVIVQGPSAAASVAEAIVSMNELAEADVLIVGRGGGSLEELWAFNEEPVVRAIDASLIPIISAVGHETDTTLADFAADMRAATPTAAAEIAVPNLYDLKQHVEQLTARMHRALDGRMREAKQRLRRIESSTVFTRPTHQLQQWQQVVDNAEDRLQLALTKLANSGARQLSHLEGRLLQTSPIERAKRMEQTLLYTVELLQRATADRVGKEQVKFERLLDKLDVLSPLSVMKRGYSLTYTGDKKRLINSIDNVQLGDKVQVRVQDGWIDCTVWGLEEE